MNADAGVATAAVTIRAVRTEDGPEAARICYEAFKTIAEAHNFSPDFPNLGAAARTISGLIAHPGFFGVAGEAGGRLVGSNFLDERGPIAGVGPITVDPSLQDDGAGRALMAAVMDRAWARGVAGVRLVQAAYHARSLALYTKLGFETREPLACFQGDPIGEAMPGYEVRPATSADLDACNRLCFLTHGHDRAGELADAIQGGGARVVVRSGRITGYATAVAFFGHAVGETNDDIAALIAAASAFLGAGFLVPLRNGALMRWCLGKGLRITQAMTLMSVGLYSEPAHPWLPSVLY